MSYLEQLERGDAAVRPTLRPTREWADDTELLELIPDPGSRIKHRCRDCSTIIVVGTRCEHCEEPRRAKRAAAYRRALTALEAHQ